MDTEPYPVVAGLLIRKAVTCVVDSVSLIRNGYEYGIRWSRDRFRIPPAIVAIFVYDYFMKYKWYQHRRLVCILGI